MIEEVGGIRLWLDDDGVNEEAVELFPEKGKESETNRFLKSGCRVWDMAAGDGDKITDVGCQYSKEIESQEGIGPFRSPLIRIRGDGTEGWSQSKETKRLTWTGEQTYIRGTRPSTLLGLMNLSTRMTA